MVEPSEASEKKITEINDVNRIIINRVRFFRTIFIRYRAKNDMSIGKELQEMNISLSESGAEMMANYKNIKKRIEHALKQFASIRKERVTEEIMNETHEDAGNLNESNLRFTGKTDEDALNTSALNVSVAPPASRRLIMITVCINERVTSHEEAYENLVQALI